MTLINSHSLSLMRQISHEPKEKKEKERKKLASSFFLMSPDRPECFKSTKSTGCFAKRERPARNQTENVNLLNLYGKCELIVHL